MPYCPSCGAEFRAGFDFCNTCNVALVDSLDKPREVESSAEVESGDDVLHLLGTLTDEGQATLIRRLLDEAAIPSIVQGGHAPQIGGCVPWRIYVDEDYLDAARETLASLQAPTLITGQIEGALGRFETELGQLGRERRDLQPQIKAVRESIEAMRRELGALNDQLDE
jgi:hypothetical protein